MSGLNPDAMDGVLGYIRDNKQSFYIGGFNSPGKEEKTAPESRSSWG